MYRGKTADSRETAGHLYHGLDFIGGIHDVKGAVVALKGKGYDKVGILGFCLGGVITVAAVSSLDSLAAAAPFYGVPDQVKIQFPLANIKVPVLAHFGETDQAKGFADPETAYKFEKECKEAGVDITMRMWPAGHAFMNQASPTQYVPEVAAAALKETCEFFHKVFA